MNVFNQTITLNLQHFRAMKMNNKIPNKTLFLFNWEIFRLVHISDDIFVHPATQY